MKVLLIDANPKSKEQAHSKWAADQYLKKLQGEGHDVEVWPIYQMNIPMIDEDVFSAFGKMMANESLSDVEQEKMHQRQSILDDFMSFEHFVIVSPMWNFGIPPQLKSLVDAVAVAGKTFKYTAEGPVGLLKGTFVHIQASGGVYTQTPEYEFGHRYMAHVMKFMGLTEKPPLLIEGTNLGEFDRTVFQSTLDAWLEN